MYKEIEAKFANISSDDIRKKLEKAGAVLVHPEILMRRKVYEHPINKKNDWFRVREENNKITMSYKRLIDRTLHGTEEVEFVIDNFDQGCHFLEVAQLRFVSYQETKREKWKLGGAEITIDTWPWIPTFLEIEAPTEEEVVESAKILELDWAKALFGSVENIYMMHYDVTEEEVDDWPQIIFSEIPEWLMIKNKVN